MGAGRYYPCKSYIVPFMRMKNYLYCDSKTEDLRLLGNQHFSRRTIKETLFFLITACDDLNFTGENTAMYLYHGQVTAPHREGADYPVIPAITGKYLLTHITYYLPIHNIRYLFSCYRELQ